MSVNQFIDEIEITIFDTETTGLDPASGDRIVEIAALRFKGKERIAAFESLVNPQRPISPAAYQVNKISEEMVALAPKMEAVLPRFLDFIRGSCLCAYNATFDMEFLKNEMRLLAQAFSDDIMVVDVLKMSRRLLPGLPRYALWFVAQKLGVHSPQAHRAGSDVELTFEIFQRLREIMRLKGIQDTVHLLGLFGINSRLLDNIINQKIATIQEAIQLGVKLRMKYLTGSNAAVTEREVTPKEIRQDRDKSYLLAYCSLRSDERLFSLDGILHLEII